MRLPTAGQKGRLTNDPPDPPDRRGRGRPRATARSASLVVLCLLAPWSAAAEASQRDVVVMARAVGFMDGRPTGLTEFGVVYPGHSAAGRAAAESVAAAVGDGVRVGALVLRPRLLTVDEVQGSELRVLLLTQAALPAASEIAAATAGRRVLTVAVGMDASGGGRVVMLIASEPQIEIVVNRSAAQVAGVAFSPAFRMLIKER